MSAEATESTSTTSTEDSAALPPGYKRTEVGVFPEDWGVHSLGTLGQFKNGINKGKQDFGRGFPFVNLMDVFGVPKISKTLGFGLVSSSQGEREAYSLLSGDVLFVRSSVKPEGVGLMSLIPEALPNTVFSGFLIRYRDGGALALEFKEYCFWDASFRNRLIASSTVSANTNINQDALRSLRIAFPPNKSEQRAIAEALSAADGLLVALDALIAKKRAIKQAAMQQLLTGKTRLPGFTGEWESKRLSELGQFLKGAGVARADARSGSLPCIRYGEIYTVHSDYIRDFHSWISRDVASSSTRLQRGDLLFAGSGETKAEIGKCVAFVQEGEAYAGGDIVILRPRGVDSTYLGFVLNSETVNRQKASLGQGDAVVHIGAKALAQVSVRIPSADEQAAIAQLLVDMDSEIGVLEHRRDKTRAIKQGMMQQLLTGRVRLVPPSTAMTEAATP